MKQHNLTILGGTPDRLRLPVHVLQELAEALLLCARGAARHAVEGASTRKGPRPAWLDALCKIEISGLLPSSATLELSAPTLQEVDAKRFGGSTWSTLFETPALDELEPADASAIDLLVDRLRSAIHDDPAQMRADRPLLGRFARLADVGDTEYHDVLLDRFAPGIRPVTLRKVQAARLRRLRNATPRPRPVRLNGRLQTMSAAPADGTLQLPTGERLYVRLHEHDSGQMDALFDTQVVVSGLAHFRPGGNLQSVDVLTIEASRPADRVFERPPIAHQAAPLFTPREQDASSGMARIFGSVEDDEDLAELTRQLKELE